MRDGCISDFLYFTGNLKWRKNMNKEFEFDKVFKSTMEKNRLDTVVLLGHINPDGDAAGCVMGLAHYIKINYPQYEVIPYLADTIDKGPHKIIKQDQVFDPFKKPDVEGKHYISIVCDNAIISRMIGKQYYENAMASIVIDHHASNEGYGDINYTKISEACAENVFYILDKKSLQKAAINDLYPTAADYIYLGIVQDTGGFERAKESTLYAAMSLLEMGVKHNVIMKTMHNDTLGSLQKKTFLLSKTNCAFNGKVAYVCISKTESTEKDISYEDIHPIAEILRDCEDIELSFTMYEEEKGAWRCSFRSDGEWINVNELLTPFGGGGHAAAAGLRKKTNDVKGLREAIFERIEILRKKKV